MTRQAFSAAALIGIAATGPGHATGGVECRPIVGTAPSVSLVIGSGIPPSLLYVSVNDGKGWFSTGDKPKVIAVSKHWIDDQIVWLDLVDARIGGRVVRLRAASERKRTHTYAGTLARRGRITRVRCFQG